ncbi:GAF domain-containing protein [Nostoc sp. UHCC 0302]|uniref:hybrid sensor histidine kinase/response regulator n=1 Tax=Nostoc sp. UHCC 0302 TaxID=3134896 RepID=UPI00311C8AF0
MSPENNDELNISKQTELALKEQIEQQRLVIAIAHRIRQSLNLNEVMNTTVDEVRQSLKADRVFMYRFEPDYSGSVIVESVSEDWNPILNIQVEDTYFTRTRGEEYRQGRLQAVADIYTADLNECHRDLLTQFQVKAILAVPILQEEKLWGLLVVNQCGVSRQWKSWEIDLLKQLATQVGIAIQQSELHEQVKAELIEIRQAEQKIREQAALLEITTDAIIVCNLEQEILFWNQGAECLYGFSAAEAIGNNSQRLFRQEISLQFEMAKKTVVESGTWQGDLCQRTKLGKEIIVASRWTLVRDQGNLPKSILTVNTDITEKKQLEAQFLRAQRLESLGTLASGIAHDLNNILTPILSSSEMLALKLSPLEPQHQQMLKILEQNSKRAADLVRQILTFARGSEGKSVYLEIENLLSEIEQIAQSTFPKSITITKNLAQPNLWKILVDPTHIHQVLMNLCVNARDAMPQGGTLSIGAENFFVDENFVRMKLEAKLGPYVLITVQDTGVGMIPRVLERIFEPFFTTKELGQGTGLGLPTVIGIVKNYGGFVNVESELGKGTKFQVYLPSVETGERLEVENLELPNGNGELILAVDDEIAILEISKTLLEDSNYRTLTASNGIEAIALYTQHREQISVVLMNMMMPSMDGLTAIQILRQMNPQVKVIAISGIATDRELSEVFASGISAFLRKPYTFSKLLHTINDVLKESVRSQTVKKMLLVVTKNSEAASD